MSGGGSDDADPEPPCYDVLATPQKTMAFKKATKEAAKLRAAIFGPSGAGKTFTSLRLATGIGGRIAVIDSERRTASKYADRFDFDVCDLGTGQHRISDYVTAIHEAGEAGYGVLIIDSLTHAWQELLTEVDALAKAKYKGNTWSAWSDGTPKQRKLIDAILDYPGHVIATMRSKTEWTTEKDRNGKDKPVRVGLSPEQGKGIEYDFDMLLELSTEHILTVIKDRSGKFQDQYLQNPGELLGSEMAAWLDEGAPPMSIPDQIRAKARAVGLTAIGMQALLTQCNDGKPLEAMPPKLQAQILNQALNLPATIRAWNAGQDSRTGADLGVGCTRAGEAAEEEAVARRVAAAAATNRLSHSLAPATTVPDHHEDDVDLSDESGVGSDPDDNDPPATWGQGLANPADLAAMTTAAPAA